MSRQLVEYVARHVKIKGFSNLKAVMINVLDFFKFPRAIPPVSNILYIKGPRVIEVFWTEICVLRYKCEVLDHHLI